MNNHAVSLRHLNFLSAETLTLGPSLLHINDVKSMALASVITSLFVHVVRFTHWRICSDNMSSLTAE